MRMWTGQGVFQWEHNRRWTLDGASEFCRADGALVTPGFSSLSVFVRRASQTAGSTFELLLWTAPIYFKLLDEPIDSTSAPQLLYKLSLAPVPLQMTDTTAKVFGARIAPTEPMGSVLFWEMKHTGTAGTLVGDIYVVPNYVGTTAHAQISRTVDLGSDGGQPSANMMIRNR